MKTGQWLSNSISYIFIGWVLYTLGSRPTFLRDRLSWSSAVWENTCSAVWYFKKNRLLLTMSPPSVWFRGTARTLLVHLCVLLKPNACVHMINALGLCIDSPKKSFSSTVRCQSPAERQDRLTVMSVMPHWQIPGNLRATNTHTHIHGKTHLSAAYTHHFWW